MSAKANWPLLKNPKALWRFLGLVGYYWKFVKAYGSITTPLHALLKKGEFTWNEDAVRAFEELKQKLLSPPVLRMPDFNMAFTIECDASANGVGAVFLKDGHPIAFSSQSFMGKTLALSTCEKDISFSKRWTHNCVLKSKLEE